MERQRYAIWGSAGHAKVLAALISEQGGEVIALFDNREVVSALPHVPLFVGERGFETWRTQLARAGEVHAVTAIGGHRGRDRIEIQQRFRRAGLAIATLVHGRAYVCNTAQLGAGTQVLAQAVVAADAVLGEACIVNHRASVDHECRIGAGVHLAPGATLCGCVTVGDNVLVGANAVVLPRVTIEDDVVIGAGAVVTKDVARGTIIVGNPGRASLPDSRKT